MEGLHRKVLSSASWTGSVQTAHVLLVDLHGGLSEVCSIAITFVRSQHQDIYVFSYIDSFHTDEQENQSKLFKSVIQFSPGKLQKGGGTGLGLLSEL